MGTNGFKCSPKVKTVFTAKARGEKPPEEVSAPMRDELMEMCRVKREQGMDTTRSSSLSRKDCSRPPKDRPSMPRSCCRSPTIHCSDR